MDKERLETELVFLIHQFLESKGATKTLHRYGSLWSNLTLSLESTFALYFDVGYLQDLCLAGKYAEAKLYLEGFVGAGTGSFLFFLLTAR